MKLTIETKALRAAIPCAADKDSRYYLNGCLLEAVHSPSLNSLYVVSTDGYVLSAFHVPLVYEADAQTGNWQIIVPLETLKAVTKTKAPFVTLESLPDGRYMLGDVVFRAIDGRFPDWRRVVPRPNNVTGHSANFNPDLLIRVRKALAEFYQTKKDAIFRFDQNGNDAGVMHRGQSNALGIVMPLRMPTLKDAIGDYQGIFSAA